MSEGAEKQFVSLESIINPSWADESEDVGEREVAKPKAWGTIDNSHDDAPDLATIQAEEAKRSAEAAARKPPTRSQQKPQSSYYDNNNYGERSYDRPSDRAPRERQPVPTEPPFTAFVGNLAYEVTEEDLQQYFFELGVRNVRLLKEQGTGKPKGFGYIEFETADGLKSALMANNTEFCKRQLNVDVAKPPAKSNNNSWGPGNRDTSFNRDSNTRPNFNNSRSEHDSSWGPGNRDTSFNRSSFNRPGSNYKPPVTERPKLNINPPTQKPETRESTKTKDFSENLFGTAITETQIQKMDKLAQERMEREAERDKKKRAEDEKRKNEERNKKPLSPREYDSRDHSSWRTNTGAAKPPYSRRDELPKNGAERRTGRPQVQVDSDGFREQNNRNRGWEVPNSSAARAAQNEVLSKQNLHKQEMIQNTQNNKVEKQQNMFAGLEEEYLG